jgi:hypothetical protein
MLQRSKHWPWSSLSLWDLCIHTIPTFRRKVLLPYKFIYAFKTFSINIFPQFVFGNEKASGCLIGQISKNENFS